MGDWNGCRRPGDQCGQRHSVRTTGACGGGQGMDSGKDEEKGRIVSGLGGATTSSAWCRSRLIFSSRTRGRGCRLTSTRSRGVRSGRQSAPARRSWCRLAGSYGSSGGSAPQSGTTGPTIGSRILFGRRMRRTPCGHRDDSPVEPVTLPTMWQRRESTAEVVFSVCLCSSCFWLAPSAGERAGRSPLSVCDGRIRTCWVRPIAA